MSALKESDFVFDAILELLSDNRIKEIFSYTSDILNPLTVSIQSSSKKRFILDLRHINMHVFKQKFKCEGLHTIRDAFSQGYFIFSFDLKSGSQYFHGIFVSLKLDMFSFTLWDLAPYMFTKLLKPMETHWRM